MFENVPKKTTALQIFFRFIWRYIKAYYRIALLIMFCVCGGFSVLFAVIRFVEFVTLNPFGNQMFYVGCGLFFIAIILNELLYPCMWLKFRTRLPISMEDLGKLHVYTKEDLLIFLDAFRYRRRPIFGADEILTFQYVCNTDYYEKLEELFQVLPQYTEISFKVGDKYHFLEDGIISLERSRSPLKATAPLVDEIHKHFETLGLDYKLRVLERFEKMDALQKSWK